VNDVYDLGTDINNGELNQTREREPINFKIAKEEASGKKGVVRNPNRRRNRIPQNSPYEV